MREAARRRRDEDNTNREDGTTTITIDKNMVPVLKAMTHKST